MSKILPKKIPLFDNKTNKAAGSFFPVQPPKGWTFTVASSSTSATVTVEAYIGSDWRVIHSEAITATGNVLIRDDHGHYEKIRGNITAGGSGGISLYATGTTASL